jgi:hypothetical protein
MIAALLARLGIPKWGAIAMLCVLTALGALAYRAHLIRAGVAMEATRRDAIAAENSRRARVALDQANQRTAAAQAKLDTTLAGLAQLQTELSHEQANSAALQSDLAAGRRRLSVAVTGACHAAPDGHGQSEPATELDSAGGPTTASLDGRAAADLEWMRQTRNDAIVGLQACAAVYDAVKAASDNQVQ